MLEQYERAVSAAALGETGKQGVPSRTARDEEAPCRSVLRPLGWWLPRGKS